MVIRSVKFVKSAAKKDQYPDTKQPEIILTGRSNVGKSSFINAVLNNKKLARVSQTPGKTRLVNFIQVNEEFFFVDLPGYGFALASKAEKDVFFRRVEDYLASNRNIVLAVLLLDGRRIPGADEKTMQSYFRAKNIPVCYVMTKSDKLSGNTKASSRTRIKNALALGETDEFLTFSAKTKENRDQVLAIIDSHLEGK